MMIFKKANTKLIKYDVFHFLSHNQHCTKLETTSLWFLLSQLKYMSIFCIILTTRLFL